MHLLGPLRNSYLNYSLKMIHSFLYIFHLQFALKLDFLLLVLLDLI